MEKIITSDSSDQTEGLAATIACRLKGGEVIELISDVGGGKTTFTRGLAKAIGSRDNVMSPTFTLSRLYNGKKLDIHHFDFYRLDDAGIMLETITEAMSRQRNVIVIEWAEVVANVLPEGRLRIKFQYSGENSRKLQFTYPKTLSYLIE